jgi:hypothetical protein
MEYNQERIALIIIRRCQNLIFERLGNGGPVDVEGGEFVIFIKLFGLVSTNDI